MRLSRYTPVLLSGLIDLGGLTFPSPTLPARITARRGQFLRSALAAGTRPRKTQLCGVPRAFPRRTRHRAGLTTRRVWREVCPREGGPGWREWIGRSNFARRCSTPYRGRAGREAGPRAASVARALAARAARIRLHRGGAALPLMRPAAGLHRRTCQRTARLPARQLLRGPGLVRRARPHAGCGSCGPVPSRRPNSPRPWQNSPAANAWLEFGEQIDWAPGRWYHRGCPIGTPDRDRLWRGTHV
jgi:hypothetical protein